MSDPQRPHGPTRLLRPRDFPGKSTGVGCHCRHCNFGILFYIRKRGKEAENTFRSIPPICHVLGESYDELGSPERGLSLQALIAYHLVAPTIISLFWWLPPLQLVGFEPQCILGSLGPTQVAQLGQMFSWGFPQIPLSSAASLAVSSASLFPQTCGVSSFWCPR